MTQMAFQFLYSLVVGLCLDACLFFKIRLIITVKANRVYTCMYSGLTTEAFVMLERNSAYVMLRNELVISWKSAQDAFANVLNQKGRQCICNSVEQSSLYIKCVYL